MTTMNNYTPKPKDHIRLKKDCTAVNTYDGVHESSLIGGKDGKEHLGTVLGIHCFGEGIKLLYTSMAKDLVLIVSLIYVTSNH